MKIKLMVLLVFSANLAIADADVKHDTKSAQTTSQVKSSKQISRFNRLGRKIKALEQIKLDTSEINMTLKQLVEVPSDNGRYDDLLLLLVSIEESLESLADSHEEISVREQLICKETRFPGGELLDGPGNTTPRVDCYQTSLPITEENKRLSLTMAEIISEGWLFKDSHGFSNYIFERLSVHPD